MCITNTKKYDGINKCIFNDNQIYVSILEDDHIIEHDVSNNIGNNLQYAEEDVKFEKNENVTGNITHVMAQGYSQIKRVVF